MATNSTREFNYDHRSRLTSVVDKNSSGTETQVVDYRYDAFNRRVLKHVDDNPSDTSDGFFETYIYDRDDVILDFVDSDGSAGSANAVVSTRYLHGPQVDQVLAQDNGASQWLLGDHLGTVRDIVDQNGQLLNHIEYDSFGKIIAQSNVAAQSRYGYTGREFDQETNLVYMRNRYYASAVGRFVTEDPIRFESGDENLYAYVANQVNSRRDPFGLQEERLADDDDNFIGDHDADTTGPIIDHDVDVDPCPQVQVATDIGGIRKY